jgi:hypothetical protein
MRIGLIAALANILAAPAALAATGGNVSAPIHQFIDGFNAGNVTSAFAAYGPGDISIIDEFAPHLWKGRGSPQAWAADYVKHAAATGVTDGVVKIGNPTRQVVEADDAYVIVPAVYTYKERGVAMAEEGQMTYVLHGVGGAWKIYGWTWTGVTPHLAK